MAKEWNAARQRHLQTKKKFDSLIKQILMANKKMFWPLFVLTPLIAVTGLCSPISVREFTKQLTPASFYDCDKVFSEDPAQAQFDELSYNDGVAKVFKKLWGYIILIGLAIFVNFGLQNMAVFNLIKISASGVNGSLDMIFQKILKMSDQARSSSASGNIANLLFTDTQKMAFMFIYTQMMLELPIDLIIYLIYIGVQITPIALTGLCAYLIFIPIIGVVMGKI